MASHIKKFPTRLDLLPNSLLVLESDQGPQTRPPGVGPSELSLFKPLLVGLRPKKKKKTVQVPHLPHAPHDAELLRVDEALQHHPDGHVDVVLQHVVPQVHLGVGLGHADHGLDVAHGDGDAAGGLLTAPHTRTTCFNLLPPSKTVYDFLVQHK